MGIKGLTAAALCGALLLGTAPAVAATPARGTLLSVTPVTGLDAAQVTAYLTGFDLDASGVRNGIDANRITYRTIDPNGRPTTASALVVVPRTADRTPAQVTWLHGTTAFRGSVASVSDGNDRAAAVLFAAAGYLTTAPDYLGLGVGPGTHPYVHARSSVTASIDALAAARQLATRAGRHPEPRVNVTGHSQGGHVTMALGQALHRSKRLGALAPIAGPLKPSQVVADALSGRIANGTAYLAYWTVSWNRLYHLYDTPAEAFRDPSIEALFDGEHPNEEILPRIPGTVSDLFTPAHLRRLQNPTGVLKAALTEADQYCDWRPSVPVRLYASSGDGDVPLANSAYCRKRLLRHGATATVIDLGADVDHGRAPTLALPRILDGFDEQRAG